MGLGGQGYWYANISDVRWRLTCYSPHLQYMLRPHRFHERAGAASAGVDRERNPRHEDLAVRRHCSRNAWSIYYGGPDTPGHRAVAHHSPGVRGLYRRSSRVPWVLESTLRDTDRTSSQAILPPVVRRDGTSG